METESQQIQPIQQDQIQQSSLTLQVAMELVELLKDPKTQVKYGTLNAILQYAKTQQQKKLFLDTALFSQINKVLNNQQLTKICLSTLIHFSSSECFQSEFVRFVEPLICNLKQWKDDLREELSFLCLLNISKYDSIIAEMINKDEKKGFLLEVIYGFWQLKQKRRWVIINIFVNVSAIEVGRKFISQEKIYLRFLDYANSSNQNLRMGVLKLLRNVSFEWEVEEFIVEILKHQHDVINKLALHLAYVIQASNISPQTTEEDFSKIIDQYQPNQEESKKIVKNMKIDSKDKATNEICLVLDIFLILSNTGFAERKISFKRNPLSDMFSILKFTDIPETYKDKLQALEVFCFQ